MRDAPPQSPTSIVSDMSNDDALISETNADVHDWDVQAKAIRKELDRKWVKSITDWGVFDAN